MMQLHMHDALWSGAHRILAAGPQKPAPAIGWLKQFEAAQSGAPALRARATALPAPFRRDGDAGLEPCGVPQGPAAHGPAIAALPPPAATAGDASQPPRVFHQDDVRSAERSPLRVHVDAHPGAGVRVWLGLDGSVPSGMERAAAAVVELRQALQASQQQLVSLVCNGTPLYAAPALLLTRAPRGASAPSSTHSKDTS